MKTLDVEFKKCQETDNHIIWLSLICRKNQIETGDSKEDLECLHRKHDDYRPSDIFNTKPSPIPFLSDNQRRLCIRIQDLIDAYSLIV